MKLFSVTYWPDSLSLEQRGIGVLRSNEFYIQFDQGKIVVDSNCTKLMACRDGHKRFFLDENVVVTHNPVNGAREAPSQATVKLSVGNDNGALVRIFPLTYGSSAQSSKQLPTIGLAASQIVVGTVDAPKLIAIRPFQEVALRAEIRSAQLETEESKRSFWLSWLGPKKKVRRVEKTRVHELYMMFDGSDLRLYTASERVQPA